MLAAWIAQGADSPADEKPETDPREHWAFRPVVRPSVPQACRRRPGAESDRRLHRRLSSSVTGLVPQVEATRCRVGSPVISRSGGASADVRGAGEALMRTSRRIGMNAWRTGCLTTLAMANVRRATGWTSGGTATGGGWAIRLRNSQLHIWHWARLDCGVTQRRTPYDEDGPADAGRG